MKSLNLLLALLLGVSTLFVSSCEDDPTPPNQDVNNRLNGEWEAESWTVDGTEVLLNGSTFDLEFERRDPEGGDFEWVTVENGQTTIIRGDYDIESEGTEIDLDFDSGASFDMEIDVDGDDLELEGLINNQRWVIRAERD